MIYLITYFIIALLIIIAGIYLTRKDPVESDTIFRYIFIAFIWPIALVFLTAFYMITFIMLFMEYFEDFISDNNH